MKKIFAAGALALAGLFLFGGCAAQASLAFSANWQSGTAYQSDYYEKLTYKLSLDDEKASGNLVFEPDEENSSYTVETQIVSFNSAYQDKTYPTVYKLTSTLVLAGSYKIRETGETVVAFGGENDSAESPFDDASVIVSTVYFRTLQSRDNNLEPIHSEKSVYSFSPAGGDVNTTDVELFSYTVRTDYNESCTSAVVLREDNFGDLTDAKREVSEHLSVPRLQNAGTEKKVKNIGSAGTPVDEAQVLFAGRGMTFAANSANVLSVVNENGASTAVTYSCAKVETVKGTFTLDGKDTSEADISVAQVTLYASGAGSYAGPYKEVHYAQKVAGGVNTYYNLPVLYRDTLSHAMGTVVYTLADATHTAA